MPKIVIKKDGRKEPFIKEKIVVSAVKAGASPEIARKIADKIEKHPEESIRTKWVKEKVVVLVANIGHPIQMVCNAQGKTIAPRTHRNRP